MKKWLRLPSPAMFVALTALVVAMSGVAVAANKIGGKDIKANAIKTAKIKDAAVTTNKIRDAAVTTDKLAPGAIPSNSLGDNSVTTPKLADGSVTTSKLADGAVTAAKLDPSERSEAFTVRHDAQVNLPAAADTVVMQSVLPEGNFVFTITASIGPTGGGNPITACTLLDANNPLAEGVVRSDAALDVLQDVITLTGVSDGGVVRMSCNPSASAAASHMNLTAVRVGTVDTLTDTTPP